MRRHLSMEQLAQEVLTQAAAVSQTKTASAEVRVTSDLAAQLVKLANEIRTSDLDTLTYDDIAQVAEGRRGQR